MRFYEQVEYERAYERQSKAIHKLLEGQLTPTKEQYLKGIRNETNKNPNVYYYTRAHGHHRPLLYEPTCSGGGGNS